MTQNDAFVPVPGTDLRKTGHMASINSFVPSRQPATVRDPDRFGDLAEPAGLEQFQQFPLHPNRCGRIVERHRPHLDCAGTRGDELQGVGTGRDPAHADDRATSGSTWWTCHTQRTAMGRTAGPLKPPVTPPRTGRRVSVSMAMPRVVFMIEKPSAPALRQASAISAMLVTSGESLAKIGTLLLVLRRTWWITPEALITSQANTCPRAFHVRAGDVHFQRCNARLVAQNASQLAVVVDGLAGDGHHSSHVVLA